MTGNARIDLAPRRQAIVPALPLLGGTDPRGNRIAFTNAFMTWNGRPWLAVSGEIHYARLPRRRWREALQKMKACAVDIASTYVFWIHHEEEEGVFDWSGDRDLRAFLECCAETGMRAFVRVGPFCHGEVRNGGLPDWLYGQPFAVRSNDDGYLRCVRRLYEQIGLQLRGLSFPEGGPVIGIQLENEFMHAAAPWETVPRQCVEWLSAGTGGAEHLRILKGLARDAGLDAPVYTTTAWGGAPVLPGEALPLYGGYAYCPWNVTESTPVHEPTKEFVFRDFHGGQTYEGLFEPPYGPSSLPFACCEIGGGMQPWYRYRAVVAPQGVEAHALVKLSGGCSLLGYYMFHGGSNPVGKHSFLNEHVTPRISYDFKAPLGEFGQVRESYKRLKRLHLFYRDFAEELSSAVTVLPAGAASVAPRDVETLRYAALAAGESGFLFLNNFQDHVETKDHPGTAVEIGMPGGSVRIPREGSFTLPAGSCAVMPFNLDIQGILLKHATAQPLARMEHEGVTHVFFFERAGIQCEYCFAGASVAAVENSGGSQESAGTITVRPPAGASAGAFSVRGRNGAQVVFHTLTEEESLGFYKLHLFGRERALITNADAFESLGALTLRARDPVSPVSLLVFPPVASGLMAKGKTLESAVAGQFRRYNVQMAKGAVACAVRMRGPADAEITLPAGAFAEANEVFLRIEYDGDVGSAFIDGKLIADDFSNGEPWEIGLEKLLPEVLRKSICVHITPRREGSLIVKEAGMAVQQKLQGKEVAEIRSITATVERETRIFSA